MTLLRHDCMSKARFLYASLCIYTKEPYAYS